MEKQREESEKRREEKKKEDQRRERVRGKKMQVREKVEKSQFTVVFPMICGSGGSKSGGCGAIWPDERWRKSTPLWREAHFEVKMYKHTRFGPLLEVAMFKKCTPLRHEAHVQVKMHKAPHARTTWRFRCGFAAKRKGFLACPKNHGRRGTFQEDLQRCISRGRRSTRDMLIRDARRLGRWFPERGCILEHQIFRFAKMILRDRCAALRMTWHHSFVAGAVLYTDGAEKSQNASVWGRQLCTQLSMFKGILAELLCFWYCQLRKLRKSRKIFSSLTSSRSKIEEVSKDCCASDVVKFKNWGSLAE